MAKIKKYKIARRLGSGVYEKTQGQKFSVDVNKVNKTEKKNIEEECLMCSA